MLHLLLLGQGVDDDRVSHSAQSSVQKASLSQKNQGLMRRKWSPLIDVERADMTERTRHSTTEQIRPVKVSKKHMAAQLVYAATGAAAHALARVFGAQQLDEIPSFLRNTGRKFLEDHESVTVNRTKVIENIQ
jgi:hypothetical protein